MNRSMWFWLCVVFGLVALAAGLLVPAHLRGVDAGVLARAGKGSPTLVEKGMGLVAGQGLGAAELVFQGAQKQGLPGADQLQSTISKAVREHPEWVFWGGADAYLDARLKTRPHTTNTAAEHVTEVVIQTENR